MSDQCNSVNVFHGDCVLEYGHEELHEAADGATWEGKPVVFEPVNKKDQHA